MKRKSLLGILLILVWLPLAFAQINSEEATVEPSPSAPNTTAAQIIFNLCQVQQILNPTQQEQLDQAVHDLKESDLDTQDLKELVFLLVEKINKDLGKMEMLFTALKKFTASDYTRKVGDISHEIVPYLSHQLTLLKGRTKALRPNFAEAKDSLTDDDYFALIQTNAAVLTSQEEAASIPAMWQLVEDRLAEPYRMWMEKYLALRQQFNEGQKGPLMYNESVTFDERQFLQGFGDIQAFLRVLSFMDSETF